MRSIEFIIYWIMIKNTDPKFHVALLLRNINLKNVNHKVCFYKGIFYNTWGKIRNNIGLLDDMKFDQVFNDICFKF